MPFSYIKYYREKHEKKRKRQRSTESSEKIVEEDASQEKDAPNSVEKGPAGDLQREGKSNRSSVTRKEVGEHSGLREEEKSTPEHTCEICKRDFGIEKPATRRVPMNGREVWLCDSCLQAAGFKIADS